MDDGLCTQIAQHAELCWMLTCVTPLGQLGRMTQFKVPNRFSDILETLGSSPHGVGYFAGTVAKNGEWSGVGDAGAAGLPGAHGGRRASLSVRERRRCSGALFDYRFVFRYHRFLWHGSSVHMFCVCVHVSVERMWCRWDTISFSIWS